MNTNDVDMITVEPAQNLGPDNIVGASTRGPAIGQIDDAVHRGEQWIHVMRREQD